MSSGTNKHRFADVATGGLVLARRRDEIIDIGEEIAVQVADIRGDKVRLRIVAPKGVRVDRREVREDIEKQGVKRG